MKRILFIAPVNLNVRSGGGLAVLAYYNAVIDLFPGMVDIVCPAENCYGDFATAIPAPKRNMLQRFDLSPHRYKTFIKNYLRKRGSEYGLCIINGGIYAGNMMNMIHRFGLKIMVIHHNCEREYHMDNKTILTLHGRTPFWVNKQERQAYLSADLNCFLTQSDYVQFRKYYGETRIDPYLLGVFEPKDLKKKEIQVKCSSLEERPVFVVAGSLCTRQTQEGIMDFLNNYYFLLMEMLPSVRIWLAGRNPSSSVMALSERYKNIEVIPNPYDMGKIVEQADVFFCPTNIGGGLKLRVMDGLKEGRPVLVHQVSARGYDPFYSQPFFRVYSDAESFKKGVEALMSLRANIDGTVIRDRYLQLFGFQAGKKRMEKALSFLINSNE